MSELVKASSFSSSREELDPLLKDLSEKKQSFRRSVVSLASELKHVRRRLAEQEEMAGKERLVREESEKKARSMEVEICGLQKGLEEANAHLQSSSSTVEKYLNELENLRSQLSSTQEAAEVNAASAHSAQLQCLALSNELDDQNSSLKEHEDRINMLETQLSFLQKDIEIREASQKQLKDEILRVQQEIMQASEKAKVNKDFEITKIEREISPKSLEKIKKYLIAKDGEIAKLREESRTTSAIWKLKTKFLESQLEKTQRTDQELKKKVLRLEFCLQEARLQMRKFQKIGEKKEQTLKELRKQLVLKKQQEGAVASHKQSFWESSTFKIIASMSVLILVVYARR